MKIPRTYRVISDGTPENTIVFDPNDKPMKYIKSLSLTLNSKGLAEMTLKVISIHADIKIPEDSVTILEAEVIEEVE